jgi:hypothetical protein
MTIAADWRMRGPFGVRGERRSSARASVFYVGVASCAAITFLTQVDRPQADRTRADRTQADPDPKAVTSPAHEDATWLHARFGTDGVSVSLADSEWQMQLTTLRYGCSGAAAPVEHSQGPRGTALNRADYRAHAGSATFDEWFVRGRLGLEQGMTLEESPCPSAKIEIDVGIEGLTPELRRDERGVDLKDAAGVIRLHYTDLYAEDATHAALPARMAVTAHGVVLRVDARGATFPITVDPLTWASPQKISAGGAFAAFGVASAISGTTLIVGATGVNSEQGAAYISAQQPSGAWSQPPTALTAGDGMSTDEFGASVAISGSVAVVGAPGANSSQGKVYVFALQSNGTWSQQGAAFTDPDGADFDNFGAAVGISSSGAILVGAPNATATFMGLTMAGKVYVFTHQPAGGYANTQTLVASDAFANYVFGSSIAVSGSEALIGSPGGDGGNGAAYVFTDQPDGSFTPSARIVAADGMDGDSFGASVGISGGLAIVGAPSAAVTGVGLQGKAYVFAQAGAAWTQEGTALLAHSTFFMFGFGTSVAISGATAVVGAPGASIPSFAVQGAAYVFTQSGAAFAQPASLQLAAGDGFTGDGFGQSVAIAATTVVVGGPSELFGGATQGAAYVAPVLLSVGSACSTNAECAGGDCVTAHCCSSVCAGPCKTCTTGTCAPITSADDPNGCTGTSTCSASGTCGLKNGQTAGAATSCASGFLADGVCCASACAGACNACTAALGASANGTCGIASRGYAGSPKCGGYLCGGSTATCETSCAADGDCAAGFYCRSDRTCQPQKASGTSCNLAAGGDCVAPGCRECTSTFCVDGVCCGTACSTCQACATALQAHAGSNGVCSAALMNTDPHANCPSGSTCNGSGACGLKNGQPSASANACSSGNVADGVCCASACSAACDVCSVAKGASADGTCAPAPLGSPGNPACGAGVACNGAIASCPGASCATDAGCLTGFYCGASGTCQPQKAAGSSCDVAAGASGDCLQGECRECAGSASCVDGVCCASSACPTCEACAAPLQAPGGTNGTCAPALQGTAPHGECSGTSTCNGAGVCGLKNGQPSVMPSACASGFAANAVCCDQACTGTCAVCSVAAGATTDGMCVTAPGDASCDGGVCKGPLCGASDAGGLADAESGPDAEGEEAAARDASSEGGTSPGVTDAGGHDAARDATGVESGAPTEDAALGTNDAAFEEDGGDSAGSFARTRPSCSCRVAGAESPTGPAWSGAALALGVVLGRRRGRGRRRRGAHARFRWVSLLTLVGLLAVPGFANAQTSSDDQRAAARAAATEGYKAMGEQRWTDAVDRFTRAESLLHAPAHLLYLGRALVHLGKYVAARETYLKLTREVLPPQAPAAAAHAQADGAKDLQALEPKMASLVITVRPASAPVALTMDGAAVPSAMIGIAIPADPGRHTLAAKAEGYRPAEQTTTVSEGAEDAVTFDLQRAPVFAATAATLPATPDLGPPNAAEGTSPASHGSVPLRIGGYASLVLAGAALAAGIGFAVESHDKVAAGDKLCPGARCPAASSQALDSLNHDATLFGSLSTGAFILSGVAAAGGATAIVLSRGSTPSAQPTATLRVGPAALGVAGTF